MPRWLPALLAAPAILLAASAGHALPVAPIPDVSVSNVTPVSGGCGPFRHRGFFGYCRLNVVRPYGPYGFYRPFRFYRPFIFIRRPFFRFGPRP